MKKIFTKICAFAMAVSLCVGQNMIAMAAEEVSIVSGGDVQQDVVGASSGEEWIEGGMPVLSSQAQQELQDILQKQAVMALVYLNDTYPVRTDSFYDAETVVTVPSGQQVQILDITLDKDGSAWAFVCLFYQENRYEGYIPRQFLACSDEDFLTWEQRYEINAGLPITMSPSEHSGYADVNQFPASYRSALTALKQKYPRWTFVKMNTGLEWSEVVSNEMERGRNLIPASYPDNMKDGLYSTNWAYITEDALKYYLDPRNGLTEASVFQFEQLTYNGSYHTQEAVKSLLADTFMSGNVPGRNMAFANVFWSVGQELGISPFHLACRVYQEQGAGTSPLISGTYSGYEGYYNYFNIGATGQTDKAVIESGLARAKKEGWTDGYLSIYGGAKTISTSYILKGQDTLYLQKFDVDDSYNGLYWHQYMQNVCAPSSEAANIKKSYEKAGALNNTFVFRIPVYNNMPDACPYPGTDQKITNIALTPASTTMKAGIAYTLSAVITPNDATVKSLKWSSSNKKVATVDSKGNVTAVAEGVAVITAAAQDGSGVKATATITVKDVLPATQVKFTVKGIIDGRAVTFQNEIADSVIYYSTTSSNLTTADKCVKNGETVTFNDFYGTVYARAYSNGVWGNVSRLILKIPRINTPVITKSGNKVTIRTTTPNCSIYYTTDGSTPSPKNGVKIAGSSGTFTLNKGTVRAIAVRNCFTNSAIVTLASDGSNRVIQSVGDRTTDKYAVSASLGVPKFAVKGIIGGRAVTFSSDTPNSLIYFSTSSKMSSDGVMVANGGTVNFSDFYGTIYARTYSQGKWSNPARLILRIPTVNTPVIKSDGSKVTISTTTPASTIYYTTDGSTPSLTNGEQLNHSSGTIYAEPGSVIKAIAVRSCFANSEVVILSN